ncbi:MAG TPA: hypothetical protein VF009_05120 [Solirubrobacterales bacterium]
MDRFRVAVLGACAGVVEWPAKVAAAIYAGLDFAAGDPTAAKLLASGAFDSEEATQRRYWDTVGKLTDQMREGSPKPDAVPRSADEASLAGVTAIAANRIRTERPDQLSAIAPELVQLVLLPHLGFEAAREWAERTKRHL